MNDQINKLIALPVSANKAGHVFDSDGVMICAEMKDGTGEFIADAINNSGRVAELEKQNAELINLLREIRLFTNYKSFGFVLRTKIDAQITNFDLAKKALKEVKK